MSLNPHHVIFFGDSISYGELISPYRTWVTRCAQTLASEFGEERVVFSNASVNGNTTRIALERIHTDVQRYRPNIVVVQFGLNDANYWITDNGYPRVSARAFTTNMEEIVERCRLFGAQQVILNTNHLPEVGGPNEKKKSPLAPSSYRDNVLRYNDLIRQVALNFETALVDVGQSWDAKLGQLRQENHLLLPDGIHLSAAGHGHYFELVIPVLRRKIFELLNSTIPDDSRAPSGRSHSQAELTRP